MIAKKLLKVLEREDGKLHILDGEEWPEDLWVRDWEVLVRNHPDVHAWYTRTGRLLIASACVITTKQMQRLHSQLRIWYSMSN
ncbi:hypothetical protein DCAR_0831725 [Daucus carota subsp. sativus]|uniref:Uncharacterized protein n=1 Tax=Daucus carota subsp. sativus TaxID=79200 RepID=A0A175YNJ6_DAUCS|nr:hypothetical protein DCAR_0831725 [Daucus carota subsp. sativus]